MDTNQEARVITGPTNAAAIQALESPVACVTLVGETGVGKTFLASNVGGRKAFDYLAPGVWWEHLPQAMDNGERIVVVMRHKPKPDSYSPVIRRLLAYPVVKVGNMTATMRRKLIDSHDFPEYISEVIRLHITGGAREVAAACERVNAAAVYPMSQVDVVRILAPLIVDTDKPYTFEEVAAAVCSAFEVDPQDLCKTGKAKVRKALWWTAMKFIPDTTLQGLGKRTMKYGGRETAFHHTTILHAVRDAEERGLPRSREYQKIYSYLGATL